MKIEPIFNEIDLDSIFLDLDTPLLAILSPNYEERSIFLSRKIKKYNTSKIKRQVNYCIFCLKNDKNNDSILESLKSKYINELCSNLKIENDQCNWLQYPDGFTTNTLKTLIYDCIETLSYGNEPIDLLLDVSSIPRSLIFYICELLNAYIKFNQSKIRKIIFVYTTPRTYSSVHYAQDIGLLYGFFSGKSLRTNRIEEIHSIVFPSRTGHEGKLLLDDLRQISCGEQSHTIYFPIDCEEYNQSLELMRANQTLLGKESYSQRYYCSTIDALYDLHKFLFDEYKKIEIQRKKVLDDKTKRSLYLVAPFGSKIFLPTAYFELQEMKKALQNKIEIEICHAQGFQYTSVYSLGIGHISAYEMVIKDGESKNM